MNENIIQFFKKQTCATVCCLDHFFKPWCFSCFYAFNSEEGLMYYKSSAGSNHGVMMKQNPQIAGTVLPDKLNKLRVKGIQFEGELLDVLHPLSLQAPANYYKQLPLARAIPGEIWTIQINHIKMTDSSIGFGKKISWNR